MLDKSRNSNPSHRLEKMAKMPKKRADLKQRLEDTNLSLEFSAKVRAALEQSKL